MHPPLFTSPLAFSAAAPAASVGFSLIDWLILSGYMMAMIAIGLILAGRQTTRRDYFLGGRRLPWWVVGLSIVATETSALTFIGVPAMAFGVLKIDDSGAWFTEGGNILFIQIVIGYVIARVIVAAVMVPHYFRGDVYTPYQLLTRAFGPKPRYVAASLSLLAMTLAAGVRVYVTAIPIMLLMQTVVPWWGIWHSIAVFVGVALLYTAIGGLTAVVWTDMVQFFIFFAGGLFALFFIPTLIEGGWSTVLREGHSHLAWFHTGLVSSATLHEQIGAPPNFGQWLWANVVGVFTPPFNIWMGLIGATVGVMVSHGVDQLNVQRVLACRNVAEGRRALILSAVIIAPLFMIFLLVGVCLWVYYAHVHGFNFGALQPLDPTALKPTPKADYVFPAFIISEVPPVVKGFMIAGILAAAMSSVSSALSAMSSVAVMDLLRPAMRERRLRLGLPAEEPVNDATELHISRAFTLLAGLALAMVALGSQHFALVFELAFTLAGLTAGAILGSVLFAMIAGRGYPGPVIAGMVCSFAVMALINVLQLTTPVKIHWPWHPPIGTAVCLIVAWLASVGVPPPDDRHVNQVADGE